MSTVIDTVTRDGRTIRVYDNGMERDASTGHIIKPPPHTIIADSERASELHRRRQEKKRERLMVGAARTLEGTGGWDMPNDMDVVEALGEAAMHRALDGDVKNSKQIDAMRFILQETGLSAAQDRGDVDPEQPGAPKLILLLAQLHDRQPDVIDALVLETNISRSNNDAHSSADEQAGASPTADTGA